MIIPVVLFTYARPVHLKQTLACLRENCVPLIYAFSDGPKRPDAVPQVQAVRKILYEIDWCETHVVEREKNLGLGTSILTGVTEVFQKHDAVIVFEDDLICVPGTYEYLSSALEHYQDMSNVMSVTGWTHPDVIPSDVVDQPYFDGRTDCLVWGTWKRAWKGMDQDAMTLVKACKKRGIDIYRYGANLPAMAKVEKERNIWAVRFSYLHILQKGLCLRPPYSMVKHEGGDYEGTNAKNAGQHTLPLQGCPPLPSRWPEPIENPECPQLWQKRRGGRPTLFSSMKNRGSEIKRSMHVKYKSFFKG